MYSKFKMAYTNALVPLNFVIWLLLEYFKFATGLTFATATMDSIRNVGKPLQFQPNK